MKRFGKIAAVAMYMIVGVVSTSANAAIPPPFTDACVTAGMNQYCRVTGQLPGCGVPTHIYYRIIRDCV